jgi:hypothetical protein
MLTPAELHLFNRIQGHLKESGKTVSKRLLETALDHFAAHEEILCGVAMRLR